MSIEALLFESAILYLCCTWIAFLSVFLLSPVFRATNSFIKLVGHLVCIPVMVAFAALQINGNGMSMSMEWALVAYCLSLYSSCKFLSNLSSKLNANTKLQLIGNIILSLIGFTSVTVSLSLWKMGS